MKILIADDDRVSLRLMERTLQRSGYEVITASDGLQAAMELEKPNGPRLALIDWMMPGLDGLSLCREIRRTHERSYIYIVLLTAKGLSEDIVAGLEAGADDYLTKPCPSAELMARLRTGERILQLEDKLVEAREKMRFQATHDPLTSLWDRGAVMGLMRDALERSAREHFAVSLLLCDIDHFKKINDLHGHLVGDDVLVEVSSRLLGAVRASDAVGRYGGEEFLIVLSGCSSEHLHMIAEQVRAAISCIPINTSIGPLAVSLSIGAITAETWDNSIPMESLLKQADTALYQAKKSGRDKVNFVGDPVRRLVSSEKTPERILPN